MNRYERPLRDHKLGADAPWYKDAVIYQLHIKSFFDAEVSGISMG